MKATESKIEVTRKAGRPVGTSRIARAMKPFPGTATQVARLKVCNKAIEKNRESISRIIRKQSALKKERELLLSEIENIRSSDSHKLATKRS